MITSANVATPKRPFPQPTEPTRLKPHLGVQPHDEEIGISEIDLKKPWDPYWVGIS